MINQMGFIMRILLLIFLSSFALGQTYSFGVVPQQSAKVLAQRWVPILQYLSSVTGDEYQFKTAVDIPEFEQALLNGEYDFAYMNPYHYTVFSEKPGYQAFAKQANQVIRGIIVVPKDSALTDISQLAGAKMAFPSPAAFAATVIPQAVLAGEGIDISAQYVSSHDSVYLTVSRGLFVAGGGIERTLNTTQNDAKEALRVLWRSDGYTPHAFAAHPDLDVNAVLSLANALIAMNETEAGLALLQKLNFSGVASAANEDWDDVRALGITLLNGLLEAHALDN